MLLVRNIFIKNLLTTKSKELSSDLARGHASRPYNKVGMHLLATRKFLSAYIR